MIDITKLLSTHIEKESIRYADTCSNMHTGTNKGFGPVVAWNITKRCNYSCKHCYSASNNQRGDNELSLYEIKNIIDQFKKANTPVILLSGGEPLIRDDIFSIIEYIRNKKIHVSLSTNGSLIDKETAFSLKKLGIGYVGISMDGTKDTNDFFRGTKGAFENSIKAIENCKRAGQKVGLRFTLQKSNYKEVKDILRVMEDMDIQRICFYHLVPSGRGKEIKDQMLSHEQTKEVVDTIYEYAKKVKGKREVLTVANHTDGPYIYLKTKKEDPSKAQNIYDHLLKNGGNRSGMAICNIDWQGNVYPDQFSKFLLLGNIRQHSFEEIWIKNPVLYELRNRKEKLKGRCRNCKWLSICNGNLRARAYAIYENLWAEDPACYLEDKEI
ncbi:radical SAM/SPASM domain-containing protein [Inediibacterium massiliense]|uniref:radical SAM/SPASM domain-containing protein n=1 Tax=Inediibacterium massiliense TaxID=1658111 RepID=UPI0006B5AD49|nr:radical SAM protein [Inediibacterium massiliense]